MQSNATKKKPQQQGYKDFHALKSALLCQGTLRWSSPYCLGLSAPMTGVTVSEQRITRTALFA